MTKSELRKIYIARRKSLGPDERSEKSRQIATLFFQNFDLSQITYLHCFLPIEKFGEINTKLIIEKIWRDFQHIQILVPRVNFEIQEIENLKFTPETELVESRFKIHEPAHNEMVGAAEIDLVLVPLLCFDERGYRVGYGKGFYDKLLSRCRSDLLKIGLSFFPPVEKIPDVHEFDVKIDFCITPEKVVNCK